MPSPDTNAALKPSFRPNHLTKPQHLTKHTSNNFPDPIPCPDHDLYRNKEGTGLGLYHWAGWGQHHVHGCTTELGTPTPKEAAEPPGLSIANCNPNPIRPHEVVHALLSWRPWW